MLIFNLKTEWFNKIKNGEKNTEYREFKPYWTKRLIKLNIEDIIIFRKGYKKEVELKAIVKATYFINGLETDLKINNWVYAINFKLI
jgi:hypothetical protein